jgi:hypothetical protein
MIVSGHQNIEKQRHGARCRRFFPVLLYSCFAVLKWQNTVPDIFAMLMDLLSPPDFRRQYRDFTSSVVVRTMFDIAVD